MKIAVTSSGKTLEAAIDPRFGRCKYFIMVDTETGSCEAIDNAQNLQAAQGAGIQAAETVVNLGAEVVITGHCGPKAFRVLSAAEVGICVSAEGTVREAVEAYKNGKLTPALSADVEGHW